MDTSFINFSFVFLAGLILGALFVLLWNKWRAGAASPASIKREYESYQNDVEAHFEETSRRFKQMTEQYQDLYEHLAQGATTLCRNDSEAAKLADDSRVTQSLEAQRKPEAQATS